MPENIISYVVIFSILCSAGLEVAANMFLVKSKGFTSFKYSTFSLLLVAGAFSLLAFAVQYINLAVAYVLWGAFGILGTSVGGQLFFGNKLHKTAWLGIFCLLAGIVLMQYA